MGAKARRRPRQILDQGLRRGRTISTSANGAKILTFFEAQDAGKKLASRRAEADSTAPITSMAR